eukprot:gb/GEZN01017932.1/.p1 GENE.gb/GEZN01017932.1/~~gb/GEZN01017932.1/.p1  ORF type:complete len:211 (+),score=32.78 gb/GEZN01017932.1/:90-722(+)
MACHKRLLDVTGLDSKTAAVHVVREMGRQLACSLCWNLLRDVHSLPCQHHFCSECLCNLPNDVSTSCPVCSLPFWLKDVRQNTSLVNIVHAFQQLQEVTGALTPQEQISRNTKKSSKKTKCSFPVVSSHSSHSSTALSLNPVKKARLAASKDSKKIDLPPQPAVKSTDTVAPAQKAHGWQTVREKQKQNDSGVLKQVKTRSRTRNKNQAA